ncbi:MAG: NUDIX domain-containing protein [Streptosporangiaceae bacterium]
MNPPPMMCLCFLVRDGQVLLGRKKRGFGEGRIVGPGGKVEPGERPVEAAAREVAEETGLQVAQQDLTKVAWITYRFPARPAWDQDARVFATQRWSGEVVESDEIEPRWWPTDALPLDDMWDDARYWLPKVVAGDRVRVAAVFAADCATVATIEVTPV